MRIPVADARDVTVPSARIEAAPEKAATSLQGLTNPSPESAKTRGERMATSNHIRNYRHSERSLALPAGEWVLRGAIRVYAPAQPQRDEPLRHYKKHPRHGSVAGYRRHQRADEQPCCACVEAMREHWRKYKTPSRSGRPMELSPCGTYNAWKRHLRHDEKPCGPCVQASREYARKYRQKVRARALSEQQYDMREAA